MEAAGGRSVPGTRPGAAPRPPPPTLCCVTTCAPSHRDSSISPAPVLWLKQVPGRHAVRAGGAAPDPAQEKALCNGGAAGARGSGAGSGGGTGAAAAGARQRRAARAGGGGGGSGATGAPPGGIPGASRSVGNGGRRFRSAGLPLQPRSSCAHSTLRQASPLLGPALPATHPTPPLPAVQPSSCRPPGSGCPTQTCRSSPPATAPAST